MGEANRKGNNNNKKRRTRGKGSGSGTSRAPDVSTIPPGPVFHPQQCFGRPRGPGKALGGRRL
eukprot:1617295-Pyramimonas_sp.AAC.1